MPGSIEPKKRSDHVPGRESEVSEGGGTFERGGDSPKSLDLDLASAPWQDSMTIAIEQVRFRPYNNKGNEARGRRHYAELRRELIDADTPADVRRTGKKLLSIIHNSDDEYASISAARLWLEHVIGKPKQQVDIHPSDDSLDVDSVVTVVMMALKDDPDARVRIADGLKKLENRMVEDGS